MAIPLKYNLRSVLVRRTGTLMAVLSVSATVAVFVSVMALARGLEAAFTATGHPLNLVVIRQGAQVETNSSVEREKLQTLKYLQGTAKDELERRSSRLKLRSSFSCRAPAASGPTSSCAEYRAPACVCGRRCIWSKDACSSPV